MSSMLPNTVTDTGAVFQRYALYAVAAVCGYLSLIMLANDPGFFKTIFGYFLGGWGLFSFIAGFLTKTTYHKVVERQTGGYHKRRG